MWYVEYQLQHTTYKKMGDRMHVYMYDSQKGEYPVNQCYILLLEAGGKVTSAEL